MKTRQNRSVGSGNGQRVGAGAVCVGLVLAGLMLAGLAVGPVLAVELKEGDKVVTVQEGVELGFKDKPVKDKEEAMTRFADQLNNPPPALLDRRL